MSAPIRPESLIDAIEIDPAEIDLPIDFDFPREPDLAFILAYEQSQRLKPMAGTGLAFAVFISAGFWLSVFLVL